MISQLRQCKENVLRIVHNTIVRFGAKEERQTPRAMIAQPIAVDDGGGGGGCSRAINSVRVMGKFWEYSPSYLDSVGLQATLWEYYT